MNRYYRDGVAELVDVALLAVVEDLLCEREIGCTGYHFYVSRRIEGHREIRTYDSLLELATNELALRREEASTNGHSGATKGTDTVDGVAPALMRAEA